MIPVHIQIDELPRVRLRDRAILPDNAGIYFVLTPNGEVLYVGQSQSFRYRWRSHHRTVQLSPKSYIAWFETDADAPLTEMEAALIAHFRPPLNRTPSPIQKTGRFITFPRGLDAWLEGQYRQRGYGHVNEFVIDIVRRAKAA